MVSIPRKLRAAFVVFALAAALPQHAPAQADLYRTSVGDRLSVFLAGAEAPEERLVDADGAIALIGIGRISVAGLSFPEIEARIAEAAERVGALVAPTVTVGIIEYAPVIALGAVRNPGEIAFRPGMTAVDAVGLAGGISVLGLDPDVAALQQLALEAELETTRARLTRLRNRQAELAKRLELDLALRATVADAPAPTTGNGAGDDAGETPAATEDEPGAPSRTGPAARAGIAEAASTLAAANGHAATEVATAAELLDLWEEAIAENERQGELLQQRRAAQERIRDLNAEELDRNTQLVERGILAPNALPQFARQLTASEATLLEVESALSTIRNRIVDLEEERSRFLGGRRSQLLSELSEVEEEIAATEAQRGSIRFRLAAIAGIITEDDAPDLAYELRRDGRSAIVEPATPLRPNDVVRVTLSQVTE